MNANLGPETNTDKQAQEPKQNIGSGYSRADLREFLLPLTADKASQLSAEEAMQFWATKYNNNLALIKRILQNSDEAIHHQLDGIVLSDPIHTLAQNNLDLNTISTQTLIRRNPLRNELFAGCVAALMERSEKLFIGENAAQCAECSALLTKTFSPAEVEQTKTNLIAAAAEVIQGIIKPEELQDMRARLDKRIFSKETVKLLAEANLPTAIKQTLIEDMQILLQAQAIFKREQYRLKQHKIKMQNFSQNTPWWKHILSFKEVSTTKYYLGLELQLKGAKKNSAYAILDSHLSSIFSTLHSQSGLAQRMSKRIPINAEKKLFDYSPLSLDIMNTLLAGSMTTDVTFNENKKVLLQTLIEILELAQAIQKARKNLSTKEEITTIARDEQTAALLQHLELIEMPLSPNYRAREEHPTRAATSQSQATETTQTVQTGAEAPKNNLNVHPALALVWANFKKLHMAKLDLALGASYRKELNAVSASFEKMAGIKPEKIAAAQLDEAIMTALALQKKFTMKAQ